MLTIKYIQSVTSHKHTQDRFHDHTVHNVYRIMVTATRVLGVMKMGNIASRAGDEPTPLAFWVSVLTIIPSRRPDSITLDQTGWLNE